MAIWIHLLLISVATTMAIPMDSKGTPQFKVLSNFDDSLDPTTDVPIIEVQFINGVRDRMALKHVRFTPHHSTDGNVSKLCNYIGYLENDPVNSVVSVTGCLRKGKPDDRMDIVMFSDHSPLHGYFSVDADGNVFAIPSGIQRGGVIHKDTSDRAWHEEPSNEDIGNDDIPNPWLEKMRSHLDKGRVFVPEKLTLNLRMVVDASARSNIRRVLKIPVDNWLEELLTHTQAHYLHRSLKHQIHFKVTKRTLHLRQKLVVDHDASVLDEAEDIVRKVNDRDVGHYAFISDSRDNSGFAGWANDGKACDNREFKKISISSGPTLSLKGNPTIMSSSAIVVAETLAHEIGHNLGMTHDFIGQNSEHKCRTLEGKQLSCESCNNWFDRGATWLFNGWISHRKLSPVTGNPRDCCTGFMDYGNSPHAWSPCSVRDFEEAYEVEKWSKCLKFEATTDPCVNSRCKNGGTCIRHSNFSSLYSCKCPDGYQGRQCQVCKDVIPSTCNKIPSCSILIKHRPEACERLLTDSRMCGDTSGKFKDYCKVSCNNCGGYDVLIENKKDTCHRSYQLAAKGNQDLKKCTAMCNSNPQCMFFHFNVGKWCVLYKGCTRRRIPAYVGTTYQKI